MSGVLEVLNVAAGDMRLHFNHLNPDEVEQACRLIRDMLKRGYLICIAEENDGTYRKVTDFDADHHEYIVADLPGEEPTPPPPKKAKSKKPGRRRAVTTSRATAVAPTAGG